MFNHPLKLLEVENSTICNARCPQCTRQGLGDDTSWFEHSYLPTEVFEKHIPDDVWKTLDWITFEGTMGDPCAAPNMINIVNAIKNKKSECEVRIVTNGGLKNPQFWRRLARALGDKGHVCFAIDGLADTNEIYRVGVKWDKLINNIKAFIDEGGRAQWQFIVFRHNEHQITQAEALAKQLGFEKISFRKTSRFIYENIFKSYTRKDLQPPSNENYIHPTMKASVPVSFDEVLETTKGCSVSCHSQNKSSLYMDYKGRLYPCCFVGGTIYLYDHFDIGDKWNRIWKKYGEDQINILKNNWHDVVNSSLFKEISSSWGAENKEDSLFVCNSNCATSGKKCNDPAEFQRIPTIDLSN